MILVCTFVLIPILKISGACVRNINLQMDKPSTVFYVEGRQMMATWRSQSVQVVRIRFVPANTASG